MSLGDLDLLGEAILRRLELKNARREVILGLSRRLVHQAAGAIRAAHRADWAQAEQGLLEAAELLAGMREAAQGHPDLQAAGYLLDAQKEFAEAQLTLAFARGQAPPSPEALGVDDAAWLNGLGEAAGELRRTALDRIRQGDVVGAEDVLDRMQAIYGLLCTVDYPAMITRNLKQTTDMVRGVTERTRGDLTVAVGQEALKAALHAVRGALPPADAAAGGA